MVRRSTGLVRSEEEGVRELERHLSSAGRAPTLVLAGSVAARLGAVLEAFTDVVGGRYLDLAAPEVLEDLTNGPPLYGRDLEGRLSDTVLRQFLLRKANMPGTQVLAVHVPPVVWKIMVETDPEAPRRFMRGLRDWTSPCGLVLSYPLEADPTSLTTDDLTGLLAHHLVHLQLTEAEHRYLEGEWEGNAHDER